MRLAIHSAPLFSAPALGVPEPIHQPLLEAQPPRGFDSPPSCPAPRCTRGAKPLGTRRAPRFGPSWHDELVGRD